MKAASSPIAQRNFHSRRRGFTLTELLVATAISAMLLTATGVALDASFKCYRANEESADLNQRARLAMHRMVQEVRSAQNHAPAAADLVAYQSGAVVTSGAIRIYYNSAAGVQYQQSGTQVLRYPLSLSNGVWATGTPSVFLDGVLAASFSVTMEPQRSPDAARAGLPFDQLRRATITFTISTAKGRTASATEMPGTTSMRLISSAVPRRNTW
jgi:prepilin-type N-terminal cleavage/methylation domain-containing protein